ncbi:signal peptidase, endoplasmic reticulum-type [Gordonia malaquae]|uniref:Signal peptidase I n=1 Tax=Gordonia malaquae NBRC 108250 TaxID=1223542 RepID=M3UMP2_GORML|nr:signal peptidase I [Gordonia malaquae]GAC81185.1 peptidase S26 family protein [Gordonia malaquae NBRC 108250]SEE21843.1 signal peptidase, endoplasmic reticulum-type [Gordonia malaquae]
MSELPDERPTGRSRREVALNVGAVLGLICIVVAVASTLFGITPLVFRSGSMEPDIPTGSLALARTVDAADIRVGDVVSVNNDHGTRISHRVVAIEPAGDGVVSLTLKGDANRAPDGLPYTVTAADRVVAHVPLLGYAAAWLSSKSAIFLGGIVAGALLMLAFGPIRRSSDTNSPKTDEPADHSEPQFQEADRG